MGFLYRRSDSRLWWVCWSDGSGERRRESTGLTELEAARQVLRDLELRAAAAHRTVVDYARARAPALVEHLRGPLGTTLLGDVRHPQVMEWMQERSAYRPLDAPPTRALFMQLDRLFEEARGEGLLAANPCRAEVEPAAGSGRRISNHFTWAELERLIFDPRVEAARRCQWAVLALTGARIGEVLGLRVRHCDLQRQPLGRLLVTGRWDSKERKLTPPPSGLPREVPVHRALAAKLAEHVRELLPARLGRPANPDDLLFPSHGGGPQLSGTTLAHLQRDLEVLGLRKGNLHTLRRTFLALGRQGGASPAVLRLICGDGRPGDAEVPFAAKCAEIGRLAVQVPQPEPAPPEPAPRAALAGAAAPAAVARWRLGSSQASPSPRTW